MSPTSLAVQRRRFAVAAPTAVVLGLAIALLLSDLFPEPVRQAASSLGLLLAGVLGAVSCAVRAGQTRGRRRRSWRLIVGAGVVAVLGNLWVAAVGADPVTSPSTVGELSIAVALLLAIAALLNFPSARRRGVDLLVMALDGVVAAGAVLTISSVLVYAQLLDAASHDSAGSVALVFPALDVVLATVALLLVLRASGADRPVLSLVAAGFILYAVGDLAFAVLAEQGRFHFGTPVDLGWIAGYLTIGLAAWVPSDVVDGLPERAESEPADTRGAIMVFGVLLVAVLVQIGFGTGGRFGGAQAVTWLVLIVAVGARQTLLAADNGALRRGLERRVREQTSDLRRLARQTEVLLTSVGDGIYGVDHEGRVTFVNPSGAAALGYRAEDLLGRQAHESFHAPDVDGLPFPWRGCYVAEAIRSGDVAVGEEDLYVRADGETFPVEITASPVVEEEERRGAVVVFRDVTQRREVDRMKNEFLSVVSHELRTPLTAIRGSLGLLAGGKLGELTPRAEAMVTMALRSTERLTRLINDLLDIERIESGTRPLELAALDARQLVAGAVRQVEGLAAAEGSGSRSGPATAGCSPTRTGSCRRSPTCWATPSSSPSVGTSSWRTRGRPTATCCSGCATRVAASPPTSSRASSPASSRSTPPTPARRAAPGSASRSAARSSSAWGAASGPRASWAWAPPSSSPCPRRPDARAVLPGGRTLRRCSWSRTTRPPRTSSSACCRTAACAWPGPETSPTPPASPGTSSPGSWCWTCRTSRPRVRTSWRSCAGREVRSRAQGLSCCSHLAPPGTATATSGWARPSTSPRAGSTCRSWATGSWRWPSTPSPPPKGRSRE